MPLLSSLREDDARAAPGASAAPGAGHLVVRHVSGCSAVVSARGSAPLKLLSARPRGRAAWVFVGTLGGGLLPGDCIQLDVEVGPRASVLLGTQASTKVFRGGAVPAEHFLAARVADGALCVVFPDPVACFANAAYRQHQRFDLDPGASVVVCDWLTSGRAARGERWRLRSYRSTTEIAVGGSLVTRDAVALASTPESPLADRFGDVEAFASVTLLGPALGVTTRELCAHVATMPIDPRADLHASASAIDGGAILRVAGRRVEDVGRFLRERLANLSELLGGAAWARRC